MTGSTVITTTESHKYKTLVTLTGQAKIAAAALNGEKVNITAAVVGDGGGAYYVPEADMSALKNEVWRGEIANKKINPASANMIDVKIVLNGTVGGWTIREAGLVDEDGDLIVICNLPDTEKAVILDGVASALTLLLHVVFTNVDVVTFSVDASVDHVNAEEMEGAIKSHDENPGAHPDLLPSIEFITLEHGLGAYPQILATAYQYGAGMGGAGEGPAGGTDMKQVVSQAVWHDADSLTVCTTRDVARPGIDKQVRQVGKYDYIVTYEGDEINAINVRLIPASMEDLIYKLVSLRHGLGFRPLVMAGTLRYGAGMGGAGDTPAGGTDMTEVPVRTVHHDSGTLTIYTTEDAARPGTQKDILKVGEREFTISYRGNETDSVYIRLI